MNVALLEDLPLAPPAGLGPHRRRDYERLPDEPRCELLYGRLYMSPSPSTLHQAVVLLLARRLDALAEAGGGLVLAAPLDVHLADHSVVQPDLIYVSSARRAILGERVEGAPDLLVEVLSPGTVRRDRGEKLRLYAEAGVSEYWLVDPAERQIEFLVLEGPRYTVRPPTGAIYHSPVLEGICLDLPALWTELERRLGA